MKNNVRKNIINALSGSIYFLVFAVLILIYGCDTFEEDNLQDASKLPDKKEITILTNSGY